MFAKNLSLSAGYRICRLLDTGIKHVIVVIREYLGLQEFDVVGDNVLLFGVTEDLAQTHVALIDDTQVLLLSGDVDARGSILGVGVHIAVLVS